MQEVIEGPTYIPEFFRANRKRWSGSTTSGRRGLYRDIANQY